MGVIRPAPPANGETILPFPERIDEPRHVRSTILIASVDNLRSNGHYADYLRLLPPQYHAALTDAVVGVWVPMEAAAAHYAACDALGVNVEEQLAMGRRAVERIGLSMVGTALRMAKQTGATPWTFLPQMQRFWARGYDGGAVAAWKVGPKDARIDLIAFPLCTSPFYRHVLRGWVTSITALFCRQLYIREEKPPVGPHSLTFRAQWV